MKMITDPYEENDMDKNIKMKRYFFLFSWSPKYKSKSFAKFLIDNFEYTFKDAQQQATNMIDGDEIMVVYTGTDDDFNKLIIKIAELGVNFKRVPTPPSAN